jgi:NADPH:quinone reductase-like Zn-dependent oxidoreductase
VYEAFRDGRNHAAAGLPLRFRRAFSQDAEKLIGLDAGKLKVIIDKKFPMAQAKAAHEYSETERARGKIILRVI